MTNSTSNSKNSNAERGPLLLPVPVLVPPPPPIIQVDVEDNEISAVKKGGRPKGTTVLYQREQQAKYRALCDGVATAWSEIKQQYKGTRVPKDLLDQLIHQKKEESGLSNAKINKKTIRRSVKKISL
jgi:hypothetical protein